MQDFWVGHENIGWDYSMKFEETVPELVVMPYLMQPHLLVPYSVSELITEQTLVVTHIFYVWSEVSGYSKFGTYSGSGKCWKCNYFGVQTRPSNY